MSQPPNISRYNSTDSVDAAFFKDLAQYFDYLITLISKEPDQLYKARLRELSEANKYLNSLKLFAFTKKDKRFLQKDLMNAANGWGATIEGLKHIYNKRKSYAEREFRNEKDVVVIALIKLRDIYEEYEDD